VASFSGILEIVSEMARKLYAGNIAVGKYLNRGAINQFETSCLAVFVGLLSALPLKAKSYLLLTSGKDEKVLRMTKNIKKIKTLRAEDANVTDVLTKQSIIASVAAVKKLEEILSK